MVQGYNLKEVRTYITDFGDKISDFALGDFEGEILLYHKEKHKEVINQYKGTAKLMFINPTIIIK